MNLKLNFRTETDGNDKLQLQFSEQMDGSMPMNPMGQGVQLTGWFARAEAMGYTVGSIYSVALTEIPQ